MADTLLSHRATASSMDRRREQGFESLAWPYIAAVPFMNLIGFYVHIKKLILGKKPETNFFLVDGVSINSRRMKDGATRWPSLDTCYNFREGEGGSLARRLLDTFWMRIRNAQAVRNRLKIAKKQLEIAVRSVAERSTPVRILALAAGTAQGVIEVAAECNRHGIETEILLIDQDESALQYAKQLAHRRGVRIRTIAGNVLKFTNVAGDFRADIVEMMGLLDYLRDGIATLLLSKIREYLSPAGYFFCCHIHPNAESYFLKWVVEWDNGMLYRTRDEFHDLLLRAGFAKSELITEPHGIHTVSISMKT